MLMLMSCDHQVTQYSSTPDYLRDLLRSELTYLLTY